MTRVGTQKGLIYEYAALCGVMLETKVSDIDFDGESPSDVSCVSNKKF